MWDKMKGGSPTPFNGGNQLEKGGKIGCFKIQAKWAGVCNSENIVN